VKEEEADTMTEEVVIMTDVIIMHHKELIIEYMLKILLLVLAGKT
jgi:hypothetical protein